MNLLRLQGLLSVACCMCADRRPGCSGGFSGCSGACPL